MTERPIAPGERHRYAIELSRAQALAMDLEQGGIDLELSVEGPGAERLAMDNPRSVQRPETLTWVARQPGRVVITIAAFPSTSASANYRLHADPPRPATREDFAAWRGYRWYQAGKDEAAAGRFQESLRAYSRALRGFRKAGAELPEAWAWSKIGQVAYERLDDPRRAEVAYRRSVELERRLGGGRPLATVLNSLASSVVESRADHFEAVAHYREARAILEDQGIDDGKLAVFLLVGEAGSQTAIGRLHTALELYRRAVELARTAGDVEWECKALVGMARARRRSGDPEGALGACQECRDRSDGRVPEMEAWALGEMAGIELDREQPERALEYLEEAEATDPSPSAPSQRLHDRGRALGRLGRFREADEAFAEALARAEGGVDSEVIRIDRAFARNLAGDYQGGRDLCREVLGRAAEAVNPAAITGAHHCLAHALSALGNRAEALEDIEIAVGRVEELRTRLAQDHLRSLFLASKREYYELYIRLLLEEAAAAPTEQAAQELFGRAFEVFEASQGRTLLDGLRRGGLGGEQDLVLLERKRQIEAEITALEVRLLSGGGDALGGDLPARLARLHADLDLAKGALLAGRPGWRDALGLETAGLPAIRRVLLADGKTQLVSYFLGRDFSVVWVIGRDSIVAERLEPRADIEGLVLRVAGGLADARAPHELRQLEANAVALSGLVLEPVADALTAERLVLLKEGALLEVPFAALRIGGAGGPVLLEGFELVEAYSASTALALRQPRSWRPASNDRIAIVGDGVFGCRDDRLPESARCTGPWEVGERAGGTVRGGLDLLRLPRIAASGDEALAVAGLAADLEPLLLLDFDARAERLLAGDLDQFAILHLATHGFSEPEASGLVFSNFDERGRRIESVVREWQIYDLRLAADLVVLSACRSGQGERLTGEGVMSLARAFLWAGASTVVVSLWDVDDEATQVLMERFYTELLRERVPPGEALRRAQDAVRSRPEWTAPRYWAGFVVQGDWR